jgi:uncharacterized BrkB/YihY/UPF0761 family membrane protein
MPARTDFKTAPLVFLRRMASDFRKNQGFLLASAVAYNTLLSIVPLFAVLLVVLSHFVDEQNLLKTVSRYVELILPGRSAAITDRVAGLLAHREVIAGVGGLALLFFSSIAFTVLENAMAVIFFHRSIHRRHFLLSAIIPYLFIGALGTGLLLVTIISGALQVVGRDVLAWYVTKLSMVNVVYGSLATSIGVLLSLEAAALVLLVGAQVIAELERGRRRSARRV